MNKNITWNEIAELEALLIKLETDLEVQELKADKEVAENE